MFDLNYKFINWGYTFYERAIIMEWVRLTDFVRLQRKKQYNHTMSKIEPNVKIPHLTFLIKCLYNLFQAGETAIPRNSG